MAVILDSKQLCGNLEKEIRKILKSLPGLCLASVSIGDNYASCLYRRIQKQAAFSLGVEYKEVNLGKDISFDTFKNKIETLNKDSGVTGIIINKPFPSGWKDQEAFALLDEKKDIEGTHPFNLGRFCIGFKSALSDSYPDASLGFCVSPTVLSIIDLIKASGANLSGARVTIVGFSSLIGKPLAIYLANEFATVSIAHIETYNKGDLAFYVNNADILISAVGKPGLIKGEWIKEDSLVIDVGTGRKNGVLAGDVEFKEASKKAKYITPVPGGVGRLTTMFLYYNLAITARIQGVTK
ncbi:MAG: bifunctional 5,10-methylenetetrahydrofolate dehydrogenase/5,10-methenyltetrahydrofolate cyclohydrolase [Candidatus Omnitrophica bacterium]|nr:bifunctional 5,10-methylenetetrahydrofolate dehydrogenase/5,10-methenyltetrahydrofolate cyclohydrolase [Candidatus Omnitrophota bacterium]MDD5430383.1 bifunctional 5,10-methylenetetrahydrofolate dehydrogenase/5,10-methenyltetrahydrofolate cyclohydrolase [Candidatus Omnitrophota bacterium]